MLHGAHRRNTHTHAGHERMHDWAQRNSPTHTLVISKIIAFCQLGLYLSPANPLNVEALNNCDVANRADSRTRTFASSHYRPGPPQAHQSTHKCGSTSNKTLAILMVRENYAKYPLTLLNLKSRGKAPLAKFSSFSEVRSLKFCSKRGTEKYCARQRRIVGRKMQRMHNRS